MKLKINSDKSIFLFSMMQKEGINPINLGARNSKWWLISNFTGGCYSPRNS